MIAFIGMKERTSGLIRGIQISGVINDSRFFDINLNRQEILKLNDAIVVFIRQIDVDLAKRLKHQNCKIVYDLLDRPVADQHKQYPNGENEIDWSHYVNNVDGIIVNNSSVLLKMKKFIDDERISVIPHHAVNFEKHRIDVKQNVETLGFIGIQNQFDAYDDVENLCKKYDINFVHKHPNTRIECHELMKTIDIGAIFVENCGYKSYVHQFKPNAKLTNFQSYGIPTVSSGYKSFEEFGGDAWLLITSKNEFIEKLEMLICDHKLRMDISNRSYEWAKQFHINNIAKLYEQFFNKFAQ